MRQITGKTFAKPEAAHLWKKINDYKWFLGEKLGRDIGIGAATLDYLENFSNKNYDLSEGSILNDLYTNLNNSFA